ncbi:MAG TPA: CHAT domain-containing tetratricopeptide repeat protein, partial [Flavisolibacter sp.]|nr:CHAT domain-containing tetratricopeptide repeat protein [Flavisolibacter sp.]
MLSYHRPLNQVLPPRFIYVLFFFIGGGLLISALSQTRLPATEKSIELYKDAEKDYSHALQLSAATNYNEEEEERLNAAALQKFTAFLQTKPARESAADSLYFFAAVKAGELQHYFDSLTKALQFYNQAIAMKQKLPLLADTFLFKPYIFAGLICYQQNKMDSATAYLKNAEQIQRQAAQPLRESERLYNIFGGIYFEYGNYRQAKNYFQKAASTLSLTNPSYNELLKNYQLNLATVLYKLEEYEAANTIYQALIPEGKLFLNQINNNLGLIQLYLGNSREAINYFKRVKYNNYLRVGLYNDMAHAYFKLNQYDSVKTFLQKAVEEARFYKVAGSSIDFGRTLKTLGDLEKQQHRVYESLQYYQQAMHQFYPSFTDTSIQINPGRFTGAFSYINLFHTLVAKAEAFHALYRQSALPQWADKEIDTYQAAFTLIQYVERTYNSDEARLFLTKIKYVVHNKPIDIAFAMYKLTGDNKYIEALYAFDQQNKAAILALNREMTKTAAGDAAAGLLQQEQTYKREITRLSIRAVQVSDSMQLLSINSSIRDFEIELGKIQDSLYRQQPGKEGAIPPIASLQTTLLDNKTALLSYHLSKESLTTLLITKNEAAAFQQPLPAEFYESLEEHIKTLKSPSINLSHEQEDGYYKLFLSHLPSGPLEQLIIIPDDILAYFPFETVRDSQGKYLIEKIAVQYQFSTALLTKNEINFKAATTASFAPFAHQSSTGPLLQLPASAQEIAGTKGRQFLDGAATKAAFLQHSPAYKIVHLATHAVVNGSADDLSYIAFAPTNPQADQLLYAQEIYDLSMQNTGLVILSAC